MLLIEQEFQLVKGVLNAVRQNGLAETTRYFSSIERRAIKRLHLRNIKRQARRQQRKWRKNQL
ncbi:hypothetical protein ACWIUA_00370 [Ursidibacter sp. B-7004-1]